MNNEFPKIVQFLQDLDALSNITLSNITIPDNTTASPIAKASFIISVILRSSVCVICVLLLVLCFVKRRKQPVQSRLFVPYVFLISKIFNNISSVETVFPQAWTRYSAYINQQVGCYVSLWVAIPTYIISILCVTFLFIRFFVLQWFAHRTVRTQELRRDLISTPNKATQNSMNRSKFFDRLIKVAMAPWFMALEIILCLLSVYVVGAIDLGRRGSQVSCTDEWSADLRYAAVLARYEIVVIVVIVIIIVIMVLIDLIANKFLLKLVRREITLSQFFAQLFMESDPLRYRMEIYLMAIPGICLGLIFGIFGAIANARGEPEYFELLKTLLYVFFWEYPSMLVLPGLILICAFKWDRREYQSKERRKSMLKSNPISPDMMVFADLDITQFNDAAGMIHRLLGCGDQDTHDMFKEFTKKEFSVENVLIYDDIKSYEMIPAEDRDRRYNMWKLIYDSYLTSTSLNEVNVPRRVIDAARKKVEIFEQNPEENILPDDLLHVIMEHTIQNLTDSYCRFFYSDTFQKYITKMKRTV
jgi:hypothetical protein